MTALRRTNLDASRWRILAACSVAMLAIANLQYAWTMFTIDLTKSLNAPLDAVQWALTFFIICSDRVVPDQCLPRLIAWPAHCCRSCECPWWAQGGLRRLRQLTPRALRGLWNRRAGRRRGL